jgi:microtubule-associated protein-like 6
MTERALLGRKDLDQKARSVAYSPDGIHLAVGLMNGSFIVLRTK